MSTQRMDLQAVDPAAYQAMFGLEKYVHGGNLGEDLIALVKQRASQLNGCAYCLDMHAVEARAAGVDQRKLDILAAWHEAPDLYSEREQAALALTEGITRISAGGVSDEVWSLVQSAFDEQDIATLIMAICAINAWNRIAISTHLALPAQRSEQ